MNRVADDAQTAGKQPGGQLSGDDQNIDRERDKKHATHASPVSVVTQGAGLSVHRQLTFSSAAPRQKVAAGSRNESNPVPISGSRNQCRRRGGQGNTAAKSRRPWRRWHGGRSEPGPIGWRCKNWRSSRVNVDQRNGPARASAA